MITVNVVNKNQLIAAIQNTEGEIEDTIIHLGKTKYKIKGNTFNGKFKKSIARLRKLPAHYFNEEN